MKVVAKTHCGKVRPINEDRYLLPEEGDSIVLVADGMGGHKAGEVASETAAQTIRACAVKMHGREISIKTALKWVRQANQIIYRMANEKPECMGMGTTMTFLYFMDKHALLAHVGDSRCYRIRDGRIMQLTKDHSLVAELVRIGEITPEQARNHPYRNIITRALGTDDYVAVDAQDIPVEENDVYLLCSDGLSNYLEEDELLHAVQNQPSDALCDHLVQIALDRGGRDNITVVAAYCGGEVAQICRFR